MSWELIVLFIFLALIAEILGTIGGFGSSLFFIPIAGYFLDFHSVLGITGLFHVSSNLFKMALFRKGIDKKLILYLGVPAVVFVIIGAYFSNKIKSEYLELGLAIFLIVTSIVFLIFKTLSLKPSIKNSVIGGVLSGGVAGLLGTGGAIRGITLSSFSLTPAVFIATSAVIDLGVDASRSVVYVMNGYVHKHDLYLIPFLVGAAFLGTLIGKKILTKVSDERFKSIVLILVLITGLSTITKVVFG